MKLRNFLACAICGVTLGVSAQGVPTHELYVKTGDEDVSNLETIQRILNFDPANPYAASINEGGKYNSYNGKSDYLDDNFYISRIPLKERFRNQNSQADKTITEDRDKKLCFWTPVGEMTKQWGALPRYNYECDNFGMWQYLDVQGNWGNYWFRVPGALTDAAHKNGVTTGCLKFIDWGAQVNPSTEAALNELCSQNPDGTSKYAKKLIQYLKFYGIDGIGINPEGYWSSPLYSNFQKFLADCHMYAAGLNWPFHVEWYAYVNNSGSLTDGGSTFPSNSSDWFSKTASDGKKWPVTDVYMLNYNWGPSGINSSLNNAVTYKAEGESDIHARKRIYVGFDQQGRGWASSYWAELAASDAGVVIWGDHARNVLYSASTGNGSSDYAIQSTYPIMQEMLFTNGTRNVLNNVPLYIASGYTSMASLNGLKPWHGYSKVTTAKSVLSDDVLPFVTRFNLGNGQRFNNQGVTTWNHKWYNLGIQDILPTWRWWIDNGNGASPATNAINATFTFDDSYFGGTCLKFSGATTKSCVRLFKTKFTVKNETDKFSVTFNLNNGTESKMKMMVSKEGAENVYMYFNIPNDGVTTGKWKTVNFTAKDLGLKVNDIIATMGLTVENTDDKYSLYIGEMSFIPSTFVPAPVQPKIVKTQTLKRIYNAVDFKLIWDVPFTGNRPEKWVGAPIYNEEVGTWYYEVYIKQEGTDPRLLTATTSWASYVVDATLDNTKDATYQLGVCAVAPDGVTRSAITWSDKNESELTIVDALTINKNIIKPNEKFIIGFEDPNHAVANIKIYNATTGELASEGNDLLKMETSIPTTGVFDVEVTSSGVTKMTRGLFQVSPIETGSLPAIESINATKKDLEKGESTTVSFVGDDGTNKSKATVSQGVRINDNEEIMVGYEISDQVNTQTWSMWFKPDAYDHGTLGTCLMQKINKNYTGGTWTESSWGELTVAVRPESADVNHNTLTAINVANEGDNKHPHNAISVNTDYPPAGTGNYEHNAHTDAITMNHSAAANVWNHLAIVKNGKNLKIYINGKLASEAKASGASPFNHNSNFYVGGPFTNVSGFKGIVDELQIWNKALTAEEVIESMEGYAAAPEGLVGYFDFETMMKDDKGNSYFPNIGTAAAKLKGAYVTSFTDQDQKNVDVPQVPQLTQGVPSIVGNIAISLESVKWILEGATSTVDNGNHTATAKYDNGGKFPVTLTIANTWGSTTKTINDYIIVNNGSGVDGVGEDAASYTLYPNPFKENANILFAEDGRYVVNVFNSLGTQVASREYLANKGEAAQLSFDGDAGLYYVIIMNNGKCVKSFKVVKE